MKDELLDRILATEDELVPSSGFVVSVMDRIREEVFDLHHEGPAGADRPASDSASDGASDSASASDSTGDDDASGESAADGGALGHEGHPEEPPAS